MADSQGTMMSLASAREHFCSYMDERIILSMALNDMDSFYTLEAKLDKRDLLSPEHITLYTILKYMHIEMDVKSFDYPAVMDCAKDNQALEAMGGGKYLSSIYNMPVDPRNLEAHLKKVLDASTKYKLYQSISHANKLLTGADETVTGEELVAKIETDILDLVVGNGATEPRDFAEGIDELLQGFRDSKVEQTGLDTGFPILNKQLDGLTSGALHVIAARKKMGKSAVLSAISRYVAFWLKLPVLYIDTELTFDEWRTRNIAGIAQVAERTIKHGTWNEEEGLRIEKAKSIIAKNKLFHEYMPGYTVDKIIALYKKYKSKHNIALAVFDYIKEPDSKSIDRQRKEYQILGDVATKLKDLAGQLDIPVLTAVQLNRQDDVADSDRIARYADVIAYWEVREKDVMDKECEETANGKPKGSYRLVIKDTRRGGATPPEGITFYFKKQMLVISEVPSHLQAVNYSDGVLNHGSSEDLDADELI